MFLYVLAKEVRKPISKIESNGKEDDHFKEVTESSGLYVYDLFRLVENEKIEFYKLATASVGINSLLSYSAFNQRLTFRKELSKIQIMPFAHRNTISFLGMQPR